MLAHPHIDPVALQLGPLAIHWYGLLYLVAFAVCWWLGRRRAAAPHSVLTPAQVDDLIFYIAIGVVAGGRLGYMLFYGWTQWLSDPLAVLRVWEGGMSFHGGLLGVIFAMVLYSRRQQIDLLCLADAVAPVVPVGLLCGRLGNFINGELWGRPTDLPWGMVFPGAGPLPRHPTQLYEALLEGVVLFAILWTYSARPRPPGAVAGAFLLFYGLFRVAVELVREPDAHIGYLAFGWLTMGQLLSLPMLLAGAMLLLWAYRTGGSATGRRA